MWKSTQNWHLPRCPQTADANICLRPMTRDKGRGGEVEMGERGRERLRRRKGLMYWEEDWRFIEEREGQNGIFLDVGGYRTVNSTNKTDEGKLWQITWDWRPASRSERHENIQSTSNWCIWESIAHPHPSYKHFTINGHFFRQPGFMNFCLRNYDLL